MEILNFENTKEETFCKIGESKIAALATSSKDNPTVRMMSIIFYNGKIYFQTGTDLIKYKQICENKDVALCFDNIQIEGIANILGKPAEHRDIIEVYKKYYKNSYETYSKFEKEILIEIEMKKITKWEYDSEGKPYRIFIELKNHKAYKEMYLE